MRYRFIIILIIFMVSCTNRKPEAISFNLIDVSIYDGWSDYYCLKIYNDGQTYILNNRHRQGESFYKTILLKKEIDSISTLVKLVLSSKVDTFYESNCHDCGAFKLIIESRDTMFTSLVDGISPNNGEIADMSNLISYLYNLAAIEKDKIDSTYIFKSRTYQFYPPPPPPKLENNIFTIPTVEDTLNYKTVSNSRSYAIAGLCGCE